MIRDRDMIQGNRDSISEDKIMTRGERGSIHMDRYRIRGEINRIKQTGTVSVSDNAASIR